MQSNGSLKYQQNFGKQPNILFLGKTNHSNESNCLFLN